MENIFFDIHMHAMDMSHPSLLAFIDRIHGRGLKLLIGGLLEPFLHGVEKEILNVLTVMESAIEEYFILMEHFLREKEPVLTAEKPIRIGNREFDTILLTPLVIDFGFKQIKTDTFYNMALGKPVVGQTVDVLESIRKYCNCEFKVKPGRPDEGVTVPRTSRRIFEIYPFMGINTLYYEPLEIKNLLNRFFSDYTGRREDFLGRMGSFDGAIERVGSNVFAGIKLYPPLGFDPWPAQDKPEMKKVVTLYELCAEKQIPITVHCSDGGFCTTSKHEEYTSPKKWRHVLKAFPGLKLNLAHFGKQKHWHLFDSWRETVIDLIREHDNVYTDIACLAFDEDFYEQLNRFLGKNDKLSSHIMFGTDYMMNLLWEESYNSYLLRFIQTNKIEPEIKIKMCNVNPARFIFS